jgi:hypothetical protein
MVYSPRFFHGFAERASPTSAFAARDARDAAGDASGGHMRHRLVGISARGWLAVLSSCSDSWAQSISFQADLKVRLYVAAGTSAVEAGLQARPGRMV